MKHFCRRRSETDVSSSVQRVFKISKVKNDLKLSMLVRFLGPSEIQRRPEAGKYCAKRAEGVETIHFMGLRRVPESVLLGDFLD